MNLDQIYSYLKKVPYISKLRRIAGEENVQVYIVGGFIRDVLLGRSFCKCDFDFAVDRKAISFAGKFASAAGGTFVLLDKEKRSARVVLRRKGTSISFDFSALRGRGIEQDLMLRDFTINSLALTVTGRDKQIIDPCNGCLDVKRRVIRTYNAENIKNDPVRIMRAYSLSALTGMRFEKETLSCIRNCAELILTAPAERVIEEMFKIFSVQKSFPIISRLDNDGILGRIFPEINAMRGVSQNDYHHLDVWRHSLEALRCYEMFYRRKLEKYQDIKAYLSEEIVAGRSRNQLIKFSLLLHDVGKPLTRKRINGRVTFYEHSTEGEKIAESILKRLKFSVKEIRFVKLMIREHQRPGYLAEMKKPSEKAIYRFFRDAQGEVPAISLLSLCDLRAARGGALSAARRRSHERIMFSLVKRFFEQAGKKPVKKLLNGNDVMKILKVAPGPIVGQIMAALNEAQALGEIKNKCEARKFVKETDCRKSN